MKQGTDLYALLQCKSLLGRAESWYTSRKPTA